MEVRREMIERGIQPERIMIEGRGEKDPIVPNDSEYNRQMNRRVEIVLL
jgi:type VI secretion system protein ImpK